MTDFLLIRQGPSEECGCPEEEFVYKGVETMVHMEADGSGHLIFFGGDWEHEKSVENVPYFMDLRRQAMEWIDGLESE